MEGRGRKGRRKRILDDVDSFHGAMRAHCPNYNEAPYFFELKETEVFAPQLYTELRYDTASLSQDYFLRTRMSQRTDRHHRRRALLLFRKDTDDRLVHNSFAAAIILRELYKALSLDGSDSAKCGGIYWEWNSTMGAILYRLFMDSYAICGEWNCQLGLWFEYFVLCISCVSKMEPTRNCWKIYWLIGLGEM